MDGAVSEQMSGAGGVLPTCGICALRIMIARKDMSRNDVQQVLGSPAAFEIGCTYKAFRVV